MPIFFLQKCHPGGTMAFLKKKSKYIFDKSEKNNKKSLLAMVNFHRKKVFCFLSPIRKALADVL